MRIIRVLNVTLLFALAVILSEADDSADLPICQWPDDFHYEYTECDSEGGRWRVSVPEPGKCTGGAPHPPVRGQDCNFQCKAGEYLNIQGDQDCHQCPNGTYSLGGGIRFDNWEKIPDTFTTSTESFNIPSLGRKFSHFSSLANKYTTNCSSSGWVAKGSYVASMAGTCSASLTYSANLVKPGYVKFTYQFQDEDALFHFKVQNDQCQTVGDRNSKQWPQQTKDGEWDTITVTLKSGPNLLQWKTIGVSSENAKLRKPVLIKGIEIIGLAYTSECSKCPPGTYSKEGSSYCVDCPINTFSDWGAKVCQDCNEDTQYAPEGSAVCLDKPACTKDDFYDYNSPCDENGQTQKMYKWIRPKVCRDDHQDSVSLPPSGNKEKCPPCNPGMEFNNGTCQFCKLGYHSDGNGCSKCSETTAPEYGLNLKYWNNLPEDANISTSCLSMNELDCASRTGWVPGLDEIHSGKGHTDDAYLVLSLSIGGFRGTSQVIGGKSVPVAHITFVFELDCQGECTLFFMQQSESSGPAVIETWERKTSKQAYTYQITKTEGVVFSWAFQRASQSWTAGDSSTSESFKNDMAKLYSISVTNTIKGGAENCKKCPKGANMEGSNCIPCPVGHYIETNSTSCKPCPMGTVVHGDNPWGRDSCVKCGNGLTAKDFKQCVTDCKYTDPSGRKYDFTSLKGIQGIQGSRLFTASGTQYYHYFNVSLCGNNYEFPMVTCHDNISYGVGEDEAEDKVTSIICRTTLIPAKPGEGSEVMAAQPVSLADILVNITSSNSSAYHQKLLNALKDEGFSTEDADLDVHFTYLSEEPTSACRQGRTTVVTLRCDASQKGTGVIEMPPKCPDGTCDGCNFHFLWRSKAACPVCQNEDYSVVKGECVNGKQTLHYMPPTHCILKGGKGKYTKDQACSVLPFWLQMAIVGIAGAGLLMCILVIYCWKKNKRLEYKYMKLVTSSSKEGELPAAETCALDEDEDEDQQFDSVEFKESKGKKLFNKLKSLTKKDDHLFENIALNEKYEKQPLT